MDECPVEEIDGCTLQEEEPLGCSGKEHYSEYDSLKIHDPDDDSIICISSFFKDILVSEVKRFYDAITSQQTTGHSESILQCPFCELHTER
jgi:hypothetical protein